MCGRFALDQTTDAIVAEFFAQTNRFPDWFPQWNIAPTTTIPIVVTTESGDRLVGPARWSLVPSWSRELTLKYPTFNARSETAAEKPTFRGSVNTHRCIVPISAYYEWTTVGGSKAPHVIYQPDRGLIGLAGLYSWWTNPTTGEMVATTTILTRDSTGILAPIHDRMPIGVEPADYDRWLDPSETRGKDLIAEVSEKAAHTADAWDHYEVSALRGDGPHLMERREST